MKKSQIENYEKSQIENYEKVLGFSQGLYDKQDVALSVAVQKLEKGSKLVVRTKLYKK